MSLQQRRDTFFDDRPSGHPLIVVRDSCHRGLSLSLEVSFVDKKLFTVRHP